MYSARQWTRIRQGGNLGNLKTYSAQKKVLLINLFMTDFSFDSYLPNLKFAFSFDNFFSGTDLHCSLEVVKKCGFSKQFDI